MAPGPVGGELLIGAPAPGVAQVEIRDFEYEPGHVTVRVGGTVTWVNHDDFDHRLVSLEGGVVDSGTLALDGTYSHTFDRAGDFPYYDVINNMMKGSVTVR